MATMQEIPMVIPNTERKLRSLFAFKKRIVKAIDSLNNEVNFICTYKINNKGLVLEIVSIKDLF